MNITALDAAFKIAFNGKRSPDDFEKNLDEQLLHIIQKAAPGTSNQDSLDAVAKVRNLYTHVYKIADAFREGKFGAEPQSQTAAIKELSNKNPDFTDAQCRTAFFSGLFWTAF